MTSAILHGTETDFFFIFIIANLIRVIAWCFNICWLFLFRLFLDDDVGRRLNGIYAAVSVVTRG
ncbi:hypothetical protein A9Y87_12575 [Salmonella enterica subsp. enterica]|nr:hypothetical protein A9Y87_12575 [Salmonella enterica subsp. enterica]